MNEKSIVVCGFTSAAIRKLTVLSARSDAHDVYILQPMTGVEYSIERDQELLKNIQNKFKQRVTQKTKAFFEEKGEKAEDINDILVQNC